MLGCKDSTARTRLFREKDCDLKKAIESLRISEVTSEQQKRIERHTRASQLCEKKKLQTNLMCVNNTQNRRKIIHLECRSRMVSSADIVEGNMKGIRRNVRHLEKPAEDVENLITFSQCASKSILSIRCKKNRAQMTRQSTASKQWEQWNTSGAKELFCTASFQ